jgi:hypothetical protein
LFVYGNNDPGQNPIGAGNFVITNVTPAAGAPEVDPASERTGITLIGTFFLVLESRRRARRAV